LPIINNDEKSIIVDVVVLLSDGVAVVNVGNGEGCDLQHQRRAGFSKVKTENNKTTSGLLQRCVLTQPSTTQPSISSTFYTHVFCTKFGGHKISKLKCKKKKAA
jgi:hypothetical protein